MHIVHGSALKREDMRILDIGFLIHNDTAQYVMECKPVSSRFITVGLAGQLFNWIIVQVYSPICDSRDQEIDQFYKDLGSIMTTIPKM